jgi:hypothetical protein
MRPELSYFPDWHRRGVSSKCSPTGLKRIGQGLLEHNDLHGSNGTMTIQIKYAVGHAGDVGMGATVTFAPPKKPPSSAGADINDAGELTPYRPMMARMNTPLRDISDHDPKTGGIRDIDVKTVQQVFATGNSSAAGMNPITTTKAP